MMAKIGFARVSTRDQDLSQQLNLLETEGCKPIFSGKHSGTSKVNEAKLSELVSYIRDGDVVVVTKLDRLGRSLKQILKTIELIHSKDATLRSLDGAIDTSNNSPFAKATISLIGTFAQLERDLIVDRTSEGRQQAMANGIKFGRPPVLTVEKKMQVVKEYKSGRTMEDLANKYKVSRPTISRVVRNKSNG